MVSDAIWKLATAFTSMRIASFVGIGVSVLRSDCTAPRESQSTRMMKGMMNALPPETKRRPPATVMTITRSAGQTL